MGQKSGQKRIFSKFSTCEIPVYTSLVDFLNRTGSTSSRKCKQSIHIDADVFLPFFLFRYVLISSMIGAGAAERFKIR
jgi:hypothetical protein